MKILVTGATGFVGKAVVDELVRHGHEVYSCGRKQDTDLSNYFRADIAAKESVEKLFKDVGNLDAVIHSAGLAHQFKAPADPEAFRCINVEGTRNVAEAAARAGCKKFILMSSISVYGDGKPNPCDESVRCEPSGPYAVSKYEAEKVAVEICEKHGVDLSVVRLATVYGDNDVGNVLRLIKLIDSGKFFWAGDGMNGKSLIHNFDAARACVLLAETEKPGLKIYNVTDTPHTMREIVETIANGLGRKIPKISLPGGMVSGMLKTASIVPVVGKRFASLSQTLKKWQSDDVLSGEKIKRELGFETQMPLAEGIAKEIDWYRKNRR